MGIDTYREPVIYMHKDCYVCRSEGFEAQSRVEVAVGGKTILATLNVVTGDLLTVHQAGLSEAAWRLLAAKNGAQIEVSHPPALDSLDYVRAKIYGERLDGAAFGAIMRDIAAGRYSDLHLSAFVAACAGRLDLEETTLLTRAMIDAGERMTWNGAQVMDKHSVGGLPGNRTTPIVVPIVAACGLLIPKTSSRAITSPAGTADTMETLAPVALDVRAMRRVVEREGGCIVWGGSISLSPADDILISVERPLDIDNPAQLVASVLSKKGAAGATDVVIDMPVGPTAKVRTREAAAELSTLLAEVGRSIGLRVRTVITDGLQPVGRGMGPALEARDVVSVLRVEPAAPQDLRERAVLLAGHLLELGGKAAAGKGRALAETTLDSGAAWRKFQAICEAQGGMREPPLSSHRHVVVARRTGRIASIDNRRIARVAKLAGAPRSPAAGVELHVQLGTRVDTRSPLFTVHAENLGELEYALEYAATRHSVITVEDSA